MRQAKLLRGTPFRVVNPENTGISETGQPTNCPLQFEADLPHLPETLVAFLWCLGFEVVLTPPSGPDPLQCSRET